MRFVSWNCCEGFERDLAHLRQLGCDVAVLAEVPRAAPTPTILDPNVDWHWSGEYERKGLALAGFGTTLSPLELPSDAGTFCVAADTGFDVRVLGIWSCPRKGSTYGNEVHSTIRAHADWLQSRPALVAGDFNLQPGGLEDAKTGILRTIFDDLGDLGYTSVYHHITGEEFGTETTPTYFHRRKQDDAFHIDFCFAHHSLLPRITSFRVGSFDDYVARTHVNGLSDHVPLILDLA